MTATALRRALFVGFLAGIAGWHLSLVGLVPAFAQRRLIGETITFSYVLLLTLIAIAAAVASRWHAGLAPRLVTGTIAGLVTVLAFFVLAVVVTTFNLRQYFLNATPDLARVLTLGGTGADAGSLLRLVALGLLAGLFAVLVQSLPYPWARVVVSTIVVTLLLGLLRDVLAPILPAAIARFLYGSAGLSAAGAAVVAAVAFVAFAVRWSLGRRAIRARAPVVLPDRVRRPLSTLLILVLLASVPFWAGLFLSNVADFVGFYILMGLGLNLVLGFAGLLDLGYVAFFAVGAYTMAVLTSPEIGQRFTLDFWVALPIAVALTVLAGLLVGLPVLRMRGDYLAIATLGFGEIVRLLVLSDWLKPYLGGAQGVTRIGRPHIGGFRIDSPQEFYFLVLLSCLLAWFLSVRLRDSRLGRAWFAIREDEHVAQAMGINRVTAKLSAFAIGASFGGLSGALFASLVGSVVPASFSLLVSINVVALLVLGGMGSLPGVVVGALALVGIPELLREFQEYRLLVYGIVLIAMMLFRPAGLLPERIHRVELEQAVEEAHEVTPAEFATGRD
ncbi:MAG: leucine/isoleucine/valine transporter permease subunit [Thermomicrobium sp.]|nr:leucine/isoleucine/valine transporter permease subunit [Thermomicrobium sp.]MDW8061015.1 leucine/isoleucine/valine transporter permease subunit [Thermomicrobium sp.]